MKPVVSIIIVTTNAEKHIYNCINSIYKNFPKNHYEIILSDNSSSDNTVNIIKKYFSSVTIIIGKNKGYGAGINRGIKKAKGNYFLILNDDTKFIDNSLTKMHTYMINNPNVGVLGPMLINADKTLQPSMSRHPFILHDLAYLLIPIKLRQKFIRIIKHFIPSKSVQKSFGRYSNHDKISETDFPKGACMLIPKKVFEEINGFDENIFFFSDEADLCYRIREKGWKIMYIPHAKVLHYAGMSSGKDDDIIPGKRFIQKHKSNHYFIKKHSSALEAKIYSISISFLLLLKIFFLELSFNLFRKNENNGFYITREVFFKTIQVLMLKKYNDINIFLDMEFKYLT